MSSQECTDTNVPMSPRSVTLIIIYFAILLFFLSTVLPQVAAAFAPSSPSLGRHDVAFSYSWIICCPILIVGIAYLGYGSPPKLRVLAVLFCYMSLVLWFGAVYYMVHQNNFDSFHFTQGLKESSVRQRFNHELRSVRTMNRGLYYLTAVESFPVGSFDSRPTPSSGGIPTVSYTHKNIRLSIADHSAESSFHVVTILCENEEANFSTLGRYHTLRAMGHQVDIATTEKDCLQSLYESDSEVTLRRNVKLLVSDLEHERDRFLDNLKEAVGNQPEWSLLDFTYLSAATMTTLGFGDIVPNSPVTRLVVMLQSISGVIFLAFAYIFLTREYKND